MVMRDKSEGKKQKDNLSGRCDKRNIMLHLSCLNKTLASMIITLDYKASRVVQIDTFDEERLTKELKGMRFEDANEHS